MNLKGYPTVGEMLEAYRELCLQVPKVPTMAYCKPMRRMHGFMGFIDQQTDTIHATTYSQIKERNREGWKGGDDAFKTCMVFLHSQKDRGEMFGWPHIWENEEGTITKHYREEFFPTKE